jgi:hypothetical protein
VVDLTAGGSVMRLRIGPEERLNRERAGGLRPLPAPSPGVNCTCGADWLVNTLIISGC